MEHILVLDVGTSSLKGMVYRTDGRLFHRASKEYHSVFFPNQQVEQDPASWLDALVHVLKENVAYIKEAGIKLSALSVTSQRASVIPVDREGRPLYNALMWQDKRSLVECERIEKELSMRDVYLRTGLRINPYFSSPKMMWLMANRPDIVSKVHKFLGVQDYVAFLLTGRFVTDCSQACRTMLLNISNFQWDQDLLDLTEIKLDWLPELIAPGAEAGVTTAELEGITGLPAGLPVVLAGGDQQCAALALRVFEPGDAEANTGTGSFIIAHAEAPAFDDECRTLCSAAAVPGKWIGEAGIFNSGAIHRWFKEQFYGDGTDVYEQMNQDAAESPLGANGIMMLPHFEGSAAPYWNPAAKGMFFNLSLGHKRADFTRAILEGIALEIRHNLSLLESRIGSISQVSVAGGLTSFDLFNQIQADCFRKKVIRYFNNEASSLGALMSAGVTLGYYPDYATAFEAANPTAPTSYQADEQRAHQYDALFIRKRRLYGALRDGGVYDIFRPPLV
ncbi:FGGY-family carbohydrate kinase [Anaeroarcus burkinensis]|uniref:FGGY-family carbohydrate kinase n=1 Tax=Anaeroarcus burkinensis TaxID=82376 RepID=UPI000412B69E|nr:FGGY-family carbohydrate kinase [Anaeroarcus burkinensis]